MSKTNQLPIRPVVTLGTSLSSPRGGDSDSDVAVSSSEAAVTSVSEDVVQTNEAAAGSSSYVIPAAVPEPLNMGVVSDVAPKLITEERITPAAVVERSGVSAEVSQSPKPAATVIQRSPSVSVVKRPNGALAREASPLPEAVSTDRPSNSFLALIAKEKKEGTPAAASLIAFMEEYVKEMAPRRPTSDEKILRYQAGLLDKLCDLLNGPPVGQFNRLWRLVKAFVKAYEKDGAFDPRYYARGSREWRRDPKEFELLCGLINLLQVSNEEGDDVSKVVNVKALAEKGFTEEGRARLVKFYIR